MSRSLSGKVALVTGAARGIGRATALRLAADGAAVVVNYRANEAAATEVQRAIAAHGGEAAIIRADVTKLDEIDALFEAASSRFGRLDILVNNAGVGGRSAFSTTEEAAYDSLFAITKGVFFTLKAGFTHVEDGGRIVSISTGLTRGWASGAAAYAGSKAAIEQFSRALSKEAGPRQITVNAILPGVIETDMTAGMAEEVRSAARSQTSFSRLGQPRDIADVVAFLASDDARWITGQMIVVNGGSTP